MAEEAYYRNKVALVTGAAGGIGLALTEGLLAMGAAATVLVDRDADKLHDQMARLASAYGPRVLGVPTDVTLEAEIAKAVGITVERFGSVDLLFNNAGAGLHGLFETQTNDDWQAAFALNFFAPLFGIRAVLPIMRRQGNGHVINVISGIAFIPMAEQSMYAATKAALNALSLALRYEFWDENIRFSSVTPGTTATNIWGAKGAPAHAQTAEMAARTILSGVARNERLVLGDAGDLKGAVAAFDPAKANALDDYLVDVARRRRRGEVAV